MPWITIIIILFAPLRNYLSGLCTILLDFVLLRGMEVQMLGKVQGIVVGEFGGFGLERREDGKMGFE